MTRACERYRSGPHLDAEVDGEVFLVDPATTQSVRLNPAATMIWRRLGAGEALSEVVDDIARQTGHDHHSVMDDTLGVVDELVALGALEAEGTSPD